MYNKKNHIHFIGIGGIGMSGIATVLRAQGYHISGCDVDLDQPSIQKLMDIGCHVFKGNNTDACADLSINTVVYSSAIQPNNPEIRAAQQRAIPTIPRALMLAELMRTKYSVAIAGSHGKTTTTSLVSHILIEAEMDPTVIIGGHLKTISHNARMGEGDFLVAEADESDRSLLHLHATLAIVTNIDLEHLETYKNLEDIKQTFRQFLTNLPFYGSAILCIDDLNIQSILPIPTIKTVLYGLSARADWYATNIDLQPNYSCFTLHHSSQDQPLGSITLNMPGKHNILNALGAIALTRELKVPFPVIAHALASFKGVDRRFTYGGIYQGAELFDDYGHHPKEIECTLKVARKRAHNKLTVIFQPHRYSRTKDCLGMYGSIFNSADQVIITDIHSAGESPIPGVHVETILDELKQGSSVSCCYFPREELSHQLQAVLQKGDVVVTLGAGNITKVGPETLESLVGEN